MGSTASTAHRLEKRRALYLHYFDNKMVQSVSRVQQNNFIVKIQHLLSLCLMTASNTVDLEFSIFICNLQLISTIIGVRL